ncbi:hypothetical protein [Paradevosia shaoguanensis]|uniref:hypothetical protein n=1 Tax=Paradevosia shaoguanensis TaxID=1335043 RepID=UPI001932D328|nr:hypothetical protein [Paradevosia shaoguanensis]
MTQDRNTRIADAFDRLFRTYQQGDHSADPGDLARERLAKAKVYFEAVSIYEAEDVEAAVSDFLSGSVPGHNAAYVPTAPQVGSATRRAMERRTDRLAREKALHPRLPPPDVPKTPESRARVKAMVDGLVESFAEQHRTEDAAAAKRKHDQMVKANARFLDESDENAMRERLGYSVGDRDGEAAA